MNKDETTTNDIEITQTPAEEPDPKWASEALQELEDWIESQGVYIRQ